MSFFFFLLQKLLFCFTFFAPRTYKLLGYSMMNVSDSQYRRPIELRNHRLLSQCMALIDEWWWIDDSAFRCRFFPGISAFEVQPVPMVATEGSVVRFTCKVKSSPTASITWEFNQRSLPLETDRYGTCDRTIPRPTIVSRSFHTSCLLLWNSAVFVLLLLQGYFRPLKPILFTCP